MTGSLRVLPRIVEKAPDRPAVGGPDHPMRKVKRQVAFESDGWGTERAMKVRALFDGLASEWQARDTAERGEALLDALERGGLGRGEARCLELGCGTGAGTRVLSDRFHTVVAIDLSSEMLARAPAACAQRVQADACALPLRSGSLDIVVLVNMLLFPAELDRVLAPDGILVWVNSLGDATPIHLSAEDVQAALPGGWTGVASEAGWGTWCTLRRTPATDSPAENSPATNSPGTN
ncbi:MAG: class I SAM-dependent methyltransferase [Myxococcota bacterium]